MGATTVICTRDSIFSEDVPLRVITDATCSVGTLVVSATGTPHIVGLPL